MSSTTTIVGATAAASTKIVGPASSGSRLALPTNIPSSSSSSSSFSHPSTSPVGRSSNVAHHSSSSSSRITGHHSQHRPPPQHSAASKPSTSSSSSSASSPHSSPSTSPISKSQTVKCVFVGDRAVGKTSLIVSYTTNGYPAEYVPTAFDTYSVLVTIDSKPCQIQLCDTAGQADFDSIRPLCYGRTDVFLLCFSVVSPASFAALHRKWMPEIRRHCGSPTVPIILVGTQCDLRHDVRVLIELDGLGETPISTRMGKAAANALGAVAYIECSALTQKNLKDVFDSAILTGLKFRARSKRQRVSSKMSAPTPTPPSKVSDARLLGWRKSLTKISAQEALEAECAALSYGSSSSETSSSASSVSSQASSPRPGNYDTMVRHSPSNWLHPPHRLPQSDIFHSQQPCSTSSHQSQHIPTSIHPHLAYPPSTPAFYYQTPFNRAPLPVGEPHHHHHNHHSHVAPLQSPPSPPYNDPFVDSTASSYLANSKSSKPRRGSWAKMSSALNIFNFTKHSSSSRESSQAWEKCSLFPSASGHKTNLQPTLRSSSFFFLASNNYRKNIQESEQNTSKKCSVTSSVTGTTRSAESTCVPVAVSSVASLSPNMNSTSTATTAGVRDSLFQCDHSLPSRASQIFRLMSNSVSELRSRKSLLKKLSFSSYTSSSSSSGCSGISGEGAFSKAERSKLKAKKLKEFPDADLDDDYEEIDFDCASSASAHRRNNRSRHMKCFLSCCVPFAK